MKPTLHMICNAHLDPVWQWRWEEGASEALATFRTAATLLKEHNGLLFSHNEAILYRWVEQYDPALFRTIKGLVAQGRWCISGGWHLQPDVNIPGIESIVRQIAEGRLFFREKFGVVPQVAYNFDSFGHSGGLPQILAQAGYKMYIHMRPQSHELALPSDLYRWCGVDGSTIVGLRIAVGLYHTERDNIEQRLREGTELALSLRRDVPVFWGIGDHGGGPTREDLKRIDEFAKVEKRVRILYSTPEVLCKALEKDSENAPVVKGDLQRCFTGTYTSIARLKRRCHDSLAGLLQAEALRTGSWWLNGQDYPDRELHEAWRDHLFNDFHDILPGSCTQPAEQDALDLYGRVAETVRRLRLGAAVSFNRGDPRQLYIPVTILSSNPLTRSVPVDVDCMLDLRPRWTGAWHLRLVDDRGNELESQEEQPESLLPFNGWRRRVSFMAETGGLGVSQYELQIVEGAPAARPRPPLISHSIGTESGLVEHLDAGGGRECLAGPLLRALVVDDDGDAWGSDRWSYRNIIGSFARTGGPQEIQTGPIRTITESTFSFAGSEIVIQTFAYAQWPVLEFRLRIRWNEIRKRLKLSIPTVFRFPSMLCEVPGGAIERPADGQEHVHGRWCMLQGDINGRETALAVVNSGQHGFDFQDGEVRLSVLRSAAYCHEQGFALGDSPQRKYMDQGVHEIRIAVTAGTVAAVRQMVSVLPDHLSAPPLVYAHLPIGIPATGDAQLLTESPKTVLSLSTGTVRMLCCKRSWDGGSLILRMQECAGAAGSTLLQIAIPEIRATLSFRPFEIKTVRVERSGIWREVHLIDEG